MDVYRTPDDHFADLPGYGFAPRYAQIGGLRMHYVDEGLASADPVLMLHGEPTWSYLYRAMIPVFADAGLRALAPDLIGFGKSDKPAARSDYSYQAHIDWLAAWIQVLDLRNITLVCQDWGAMLGLRLAAEHNERFARIVVANGFLPAAWRPPQVPLRLWRAFAAHSPWFPIGGIVAAGCRRKLTPAEAQAYDAPFPDLRFTAGARAFPGLVPVATDDPAMAAHLAAGEALGRWDKPFLTVFGTGDPMLGHADGPLQAHVPGARGQPHRRIAGGHFIQEDQGAEIARMVVAWLSDPAPPRVEGPNQPEEGSAAGAAAPWEGSVMEYEFNSFCNY